jgi:hypothetical protein
MHKHRERQQEYLWALFAWEHREQLGHLIHPMVRTAIEVVETWEGVKDVSQT